MSLRRMMRTFVGAGLTVVLWTVLGADGITMQLGLALVGFGLAYGADAMVPKGKDTSQKPSADRVQRLISRGRLDDAWRIAVRMRRDDPSNAEGWAYAAQIALGRGDLDEADKLARICLELEGAQPVALQVQADVAARRGPELT